MTFHVLINTFCLFIREKMKSDRHVNFDTQSSTHVLLNHRNELKVFIRNNRVEQFVKTKNILNYDERDFFCTETLFVASTRYIMTFFNETINDDADDVVFLRWKKIDNKVHRDISSALLRNKQWNQEIVNLVARCFTSLTRIAIANVSFDDVFQTKLIIKSFNKFDDMIFIEMIICWLIVNFLKKFNLLIFKNL